MARKIPIKIRIKTSTGCHATNLQDRLHELCRSNLGGREGACKLSLSGFRYPVGCSRLSYRQPDQDDGKKYGDDQECNAPTSIETIAAFA